MRQFVAPLGAFFVLLAALAHPAVADEAPPIRLALEAPPPVTTPAVAAPMPTPPEAPPPNTGISYFTVHRVLGTTALGAFASALVIGAASGNLGKLTDENHCCPGGGDRVQPWRTVDRALVTTGIVAYSGAAGMALWNLVVRDPPSAANPRPAHNAHRWLAIAHGAAFAVAAATGLVMYASQDDDPQQFAAAARVHVAANVLLVPLLTAAFSNILFE